jgi:itaconyl-CoA hydratase
MSVVSGWEGRFFEDFNVGDVYRCRLGRTVTEADNIWFTLLTNNTNQIHFNNDFARRTEFGKCLINSTLTLAIVTGMGVTDVSENGVALGWDEVKLPHPLFAGDTLYSESQVLEKRESRSNPKARRRQGSDPRDTAGGQGRHRLRAERAGVEEGPRADAGHLSGGQRLATTRTSA